MRLNSYYKMTIKMIQIKIKEILIILKMSSRNSKKKSKKIIRKKIIRKAKTLKLKNKIKLQ